MDEAEKKDKMEKMRKWSIDEYDRVLSEELQLFLPDRVFDFHAHPYFKDHIDTGYAPMLGLLPREGGIDGWRETVGFQVGENRLKGGLFFGLPILKTQNLLDGTRTVNLFIRNELIHAKNLEQRGLMMISHLMDPSEAEALSASSMIAGFKPYVTLNPGCGIASEIPDYLPEWALEIADRKGLVIMLHIMKEKALGDRNNIDEIKRICKRYPSMKLILAHAGCGFNMYNTINNIHELTGIENLWFDTSSITEAAPINALIRACGAGRVMWGTDYPTTTRKGRIVTTGDTFFEIQSNTILPDKISKGGNLALMGLEGIRATVDAIRECNLKEDGLEDIFYDNAASLLGI